MNKVLGIGWTIAMVFLFIQVYFTSESQKETAIYKAKYDSLVHKVDTMQYKSDSLWGENFIHQTEAMRYQIATEMLEEENPKAAAEFYKRLSQTE